MIATVPYYVINWNSLALSLKEQDKNFSTQTRDNLHSLYELCKSTAVRACVLANKQMERDRWMNGWMDGQTDKLLRWLSRWMGM